MKIKKIQSFQGEATLPGDKSISHRAILLGAISTGTTIIQNCAIGADCLATCRCMAQLGVSIEHHHTFLSIHGLGLHGLCPATASLDVGNSGTTARLLSGILVGQSFDTVLSGDISLQQRPMERLITPLTQMGARIQSLQQHGYAPLHITPNTLHGISYTTPIPSAQIKSALLFAGLYSQQGDTTITESVLSRNHSEHLFSVFGASLVSYKDSNSPSFSVRIKPCEQLYGQQLQIPGDMSSAAYLIAAALLVPHSKLLIKNVGLNPTRTGMIDVCRSMGGKIELLDCTTVNQEPVGTLFIQSSELHGVTIGGAVIPSLIDELPILAVLAACAQGDTLIQDASELKVKESNRIDTIVQNLSAMGAVIIPTEDGMHIQGGTPLHGTVIHSHYDHRIAMAFSIAGFVADGTTIIEDTQCVDVSFPGFYEQLRQLSTHF
ncbi:MAG: 3-phosphoshikimate 1-carboxyvinyltransferase [Lachnospiraceae bacterium]